MVITQHAVATVFARHETSAAASFVAVVQQGGWFVALVAAADDHRIVTEVHHLSTVEHRERALPSARITEFFGVAHDATVDLHDVGKTAIFHHRGQHLTADSASAVGEDWRVFEVVVLAGIEELDEIMGGVCGRDYRALEASHLGFDRVAAVEKHEVRVLGDHLFDVFRFDVEAAVDHAVSVNFQLIGGTKCHDLLADLDRQAREVE